MKTVLMLGLLLGAFTAMAQTTQSPLPEAGNGKNYTLLLKDGSLVSGRIVRRDSANLVVRQRNGRLTYVDLELFDRVVADRISVPTSATSPAAGVSLDAADGPDNYLILFKDGTQVLGRVVSRDSTMLVIRKRNGQLTYADPALVETVQDPRITAVLGPENTFAPFMVLNQTAYSADPGRLYYRNVMLLYNEFNYGLSRNWSIGASVVPAAWFYPGPWDGVGVSFQSKLSFPLGSLVRVGANATYQPSRIYEIFRVNSVWTLQALASLGDSERNITIGYGRSSNGNGKRSRQPYFTFGALLKLSPGLSFVTDNTLYTNQNSYYSDIASLFSAAIRFDRPRHTFDLGALGQTYALTFFSDGSRNPRFYPYLAYNLRIGR